MARCEDFPCCGHENGCCPDFDASGRQTNMRCTCGAVVPLSSRSSLCPSCLRGDDEYYNDDEDMRHIDEDAEPFYAECDENADFADDEDFEDFRDTEDSWLDGSYENDGGDY